MLKDHDRPTENLEVLRIEFDYKRELVTIIYRHEKKHYAQYLSFIVWNQNKCFNGNDLARLIKKYL